MPGETINFELKVNSNIKRETQEAKEFHKTISAAAAAAQNIDYGRARGAMGSTGASARDFANQAQGLGGLVRVYAALAANTYAAAAAFNALRDAMNTTNMIEGLNQLGTQTGQALGAVSKQFVQVTGNALSLRDAMEATAQASAAGLSTEQFLKLGEVAKKASQALGRDVNDSVNRLTRGIVKQEPELLDELGLFTKIEKATEDYARSLGKSTSQLTDFERRQAFANAVLKEGIDKFGAIKLDTNPYDKLLATLKDTLQVTLEVINVGIKPLVELLNSNPVALKALMVGLLGIIAKQFIPAIRDWRTNIAQGAEEANKALTTRSKAAEGALKAAQGQALEKKDIAAEKWVKQVDVAESKLKSIAAGGLTPKAKAIISKADLTDITQKEIDYIEKLGQKNTKLAAQYKQLAISLNMAKKAHEDYVKTEQKAQQRLDKPGAFTALGAARFQEERARRTAAGRALVSEAYETAGTGGLKNAFGGLFKGISEQKLGVVRGTITAIGGSAAIAAQGVGILFSGLTRFAGAIGIAYTAAELLDGILGKNTKEVDAFNESIEKSTPLIDTATRVQKEFGNEISTKALNARANAFEALNKSVEDVTNNFQTAINASSGWDLLKENIKGALGFGLQADFAENIAQQWAAQLNLIPEGPIRDAIAEKLKAAARSSTVTVEDLAKGIRSQSRATVSASVATGQAALTQQAKAQKESSTAAMVVSENLKSIDKAAQNVINTLKITDPIGQFGEELLKLGMNLGKAFSKADSSIASLKESLKDAQTLRFVDPKALEQLRDIEVTLPMITKQLESWTSEANRLRAQIDPEGNLKKALRENAARKDISPEQKELTRAGIQSTLTEREEKFAKAEAERNKFSIAYNQLQVQLSNVAKSIATAGYEYINKAYTTAIQQASINMSKFLISGLNVPGVAKRTADLTIQELKIQEDQVSIASRLNDTMLQNNIINEKGNLLKEQDNLAQKQKKEGLSAVETDRLKEIGNVLPEIDILFKSIQSGTLAANATSAIPLIQSFMLQSNLANTQVRAQRAQIGGRRAQAGIEGRLGTIQEEAQLEQIRLGYVVQRRQKEQELYNLQIAGLDYLTDSQMLVKQNFETTIQQLEQERAIKQVDSELSLVRERISKATGEDLALALTSEGVLREKRKVLVDIQGIEQKTLTVQQQQAIITNNLAKTLSDREQSFKLTEQNVRGREAEVSAALELLQIQNQLNPLNEDEFTQREKSIKLRQLNLEQERSQAQLQKERQDANLKYQADIDKILAADPLADTSAIIDRLNSSTQYYNNEMMLLERNNRLKKEALDLTYSQSAREKAYGDAFKNTFSSMADAIVSWAQTGKWAGKDLFKSLTADLLRYELRLQMSEVYRGVRNPLLNAFGFGNSGAAATAAEIPFAAIPGLAKGDYFNNGIMPYAKGGMFTNSIVDQPTLFKFAKGTGLMGEAGPEAIMPLKRDSQGNLGVRGNGQKTEVIVNNYSGTPATTQESTDSRGNRKIEVIIGEAAATDIGRSGSNSQRAMRGTFGLRPQLLRR